MTNNGGKTRPKGYMVGWEPRQEAAEVIVATREILREYASYGPMTVRQIFYRLVGNYGYDKTERAYKRLAENLVKARRSRMIGFDQIRDDGGTTAGGQSGYTDLPEFLAALERFGDQYRINLHQDQPVHIEMFCEAEGMVPMLGGMVQDYGVRITGTGGFSSLTVTHGIARQVVRRWREERKPTIFMHVGDYDPSGESIFLSMCQDVGSFASALARGLVDPRNGEVEDDDGNAIFVPRRIALTEDQVAEFGLPTAPPKPSDSRSRRWVGETTQAEAMPPTLLEQVVTSAIREHVDQDRIDTLQEQEDAEREWLGPKVTEAVAAIREDYDAR